MQVEEWGCRGHFRVGHMHIVYTVDTCCVPSTVRHHLLHLCTRITVIIRSCFWISGLGTLITIRSHPRRNAGTLTVQGLHFPQVPSCVLLYIPMYLGCRYQDSPASLQQNLLSPNTQTRETRIYPRQSQACMPGACLQVFHFLCFAWFCCSSYTHPGGFPFC